MAALNRTQLVVAALGLVGVIGAAVLTNWDKLNPDPKKDKPAPGTTQSVTGNNNVQVSGSNNVVNPLTPPRPCRDRSHGVERYQRAFDVSRSSGWLGGGHTQDEWCGQVVNELRAQNPDGAFSVRAQSESSKGTCPPFNCPQYQYHCGVHADVEPLFVERLSSACR